MSVKDNIFLNRYPRALKDLFICFWVEITNDVQFFKIRNQCWNPQLLHVPHEKNYTKQEMFQKHAPLGAKFKITTYMYKAWLQPLHQVWY